nr:MAG TPA: hypothetical protein [Caudoviricetes sp.]
MEKWNGQKLTNVTDHGKTMRQEAIHTCCYEV